MKCFNNLEDPLDSEIFGDGEEEEIKEEKERPQFKEAKIHWYFITFNKCIKQ